MSSLANGETAWIIAAKHTPGQPVIVTWDRPIVLDPQVDSIVELIDLNRNITLPIGSQDMAVYGSILTISMPEQAMQPSNIYSLVIKAGPGIQTLRGNPSSGIPQGSYLLQSRSLNLVHNITTVLATVGLSQLPLKEWQGEAKPMERAFMGAISSVVQARGLKMELLISDVRKG